MTVPLSHVLLLSAVLFALGLTGLWMRRNLVFMLMALEIQFNAAGLAFIAAGARWGQADGQVFFVLILTLAAAEIGVGMGLALQLYHHFRTLDMDRVCDLRERR